MVKNYRVDFEAIKARADFRAVLAHYGIALLGQGEQAKARCPFHDDERPSCSVNLERRIFHCHAGSCGVSGNVLEFVHRMETKDGEIVSLREAAVKLAGICGIELDQGSGRGKPNEGRRAPSGRGKALGKADRGNGAERGSNRPQPAPVDATAPNKPLGFQLQLDADHPYVDARVPSSLITPNGRPLRDVFGVGLCQKGSMAGRLCVPIHDAGGNLVAYAGRWIGEPETLPEGEEKWKLPAGFRKNLELFNLHRVRRCRQLCVVEGFFDAIRLHGLRLGAVALMGTSLSDEQVALLREHCTALRCVTVLLDGDEAGRHAAEPIAGKLAQHWWVKIASLPDGEEPDTVDEPTLVELLTKDREL